MKELEKMAQKEKGISKSLLESLMGEAEGVGGCIHICTNIIGLECSDLTSTCIVVAWLVALCSIHAQQSVRGRGGGGGYKLPRSILS